MTVGQPESHLQPVERAEIADVLGLLGAGATGSILMALGGGPLRTKELTTRISGYAPRTIYRYTSKLVEMGAIEREEEPGVPSKVVHQLTEPCGAELFSLIDAYARVSMDRLPNGEIVPHAWRFLALLANLWESGLFHELAVGPCTATELARVDHDLSFHQVSRRINLFIIGGVLCETQDEGRRRRYHLTDQARRAMALIAGIGHWRERHLSPNGKPSMSEREAAGLLRASLPLVVLPQHAGKGFGLEIIPPSRTSGTGDETAVWAAVERDGTVTGCAAPATSTDGWGRGRVEAWIEMLLQGRSRGIRIKGDDGLVKAGLRELHSALWREEALDGGAHRTLVPEPAG